MNKKDLAEVERLNATLDFYGKVGKRIDEMSPEEKQKWKQALQKVRESLEEEE